MQKIPRNLQGRIDLDLITGRLMVPSTVSKNGVGDTDLQELTSVEVEADINQ